MLFLDQFHGGVQVAEYSMIRLPPGKATQSHRDAQAKRSGVVFVFSEYPTDSVKLS